MTSTGKLLNGFVDVLHSVVYRALDLHFARQMTNTDLSLDCLNFSLTSTL